MTNFLIPAEVHSDDYAVEIKFDAAPWFEQASGGEILDLVDCEWGGDQPADYVAYFFDEGSTKRLFNYLNFNPQTINGEPIGFECHIEEESAMRWLQEHRPDIAAKIKENEWENH